MCEFNDLSGLNAGVGGNCVRRLTPVINHGSPCGWRVRPRSVSDNAVQPVRVRLLRCHAEARRAQAAPHPALLLLTLRNASIISNGGHGSDHEGARHRRAGSSSTRRLPQRLPPNVFPSCVRRRVALFADAARLCRSDVAPDVLIKQQTLPIEADRSIRHPSDVLFMCRVSFLD